MRIRWRTKSALNAYETNKAQGEQHLLYNLSSAVKSLFKLGLLHWRSGDMKAAFDHFARCANAYNKWGQRCGDVCVVRRFFGKLSVKALLRLSLFRLPQHI